VKIRLISRRIVLNMTCKNNQFSNSNDINYLRKSNKESKQKKFDSYKKSFQDLTKKEKIISRTNDLRSHKSKKYTQSYDSNQFNFKFKRRKKGKHLKDENQRISPKKINIIHEGCKITKDFA
jgi:hypothetical protein